MIRALVDTSFTLRATLLSGSTPTDPSPDTATVEVVRKDGTVVLAAGAATDNLGTGIFGRTLTAEEMGLLDTLEARWTGTTSNGEPFTIVTHTEVVGGFLCPLSDLTGDFPQGAAETDADYDARLAKIRTAAEQRLESQCHQAFVPRYAYETRIARRRLRLSHAPRLIRSLEIDDTVYPQSTIDALVIAGSVVHFGSGLSRWYGPTTIGYEHGLDYPSEDIREAVRLAATETFTSTPDGRVVRREADGQAVTYASPSSSGGFMDPVLRAIVRDHQPALVA